MSEVEIDDKRIMTYGAGLKHHFNQYFANSRLIGFQVAALAAYSNFDVHYTFAPLVIQQVAKLEDIQVDADILLFQLLSSSLLEIPTGLGLRLWELPILISNM